MDPFCLMAFAIGGEIVDLVEQTGFVAKLVLVILLVFSLFSWAIIAAKWGALRRAKVQSSRFLRAFRKSGRMQEMAAVSEQFKPSPLVPVFEGLSMSCAGSPAECGWSPYSGRFRLRLPRS